MLSSFLSQGSQEGRILPQVSQKRIWLGLYISYVFPYKEKFYDAFCCQLSLELNILFINGSI